MTIQKVVNFTKVTKSKKGKGIMPILIVRITKVTKAIKCKGIMPIFDKIK